MLPLVRRIVGDILAEGQALNEGRPEGGPEAARLRMESLIRELADLGCLYKDWSYTVGLVDFPAWVDGKEVFLCWRSDEDRIGHYHPLDSGYMGRRPLR